MPGDRIPHSVLPSAEIGTAQFSLIMLIYYTVSTPQAVYNFVINPDVGVARVTSWILKGQKGNHRSTTMPIDAARKFARQLQAK